MLNENWNDHGRIFRSLLFMESCATIKPHSCYEGLLVRLEPFIEELLNGLEKLHAILLHDDRMRPFAYLDVTLIGDIGQFGKVGVEHVAWQVCVPFCVGKEGRDSDFCRVIECFS